MAAFYVMARTLGRHLEVLGVPFAVVFAADEV